MKKTEKQILQKDGLLYFNKSHRISPSKPHIAQGYPVGAINFYIIAAAVMSVLILLSILFLR